MLIVLLLILSFFFRYFSLSITYVLLIFAQVLPSLEWLQTQYLFV